MGRWTPVRQNARLSTRIEATIETGEQRYVVTLLSVSEGGFYCEGFDLDGVDETFHLEFCLDPAGPAWSPTPGAAGWRSKMGGGACAFPLRVGADLLYLMLADQAGDEGERIGLGARFTGMTVRQLDELKDFIARETFRATEWRTAGGAVPVNRHGAGGPDRER